MSAVESVGATFFFRLGLCFFCGVASAAQITSSKSGSSISAGGDGDVAGDGDGDGVSPAGPGNPSIKACALLRASVRTKRADRNTASIDSSIVVRPTPQTTALYFCACVGLGKGTVLGLDWIIRLNFVDIIREQEGCAPCLAPRKFSAKFYSPQKES